MTDPRLERLFASLNASFDAAVARQEDEAATDLAVSLRHDRALADVVLRGSWTVRLAGGGRARVAVAARDFVGTGGDRPTVVPTSHAVLDAVDGSRPSGTDLSLLEFLRALARRAAPVSIEHTAGQVNGRLTLAAAEYLLVEGARGRIVVPLHSASAIGLWGFRWGDVL